MNHEVSTRVNARLQVMNAVISEIERHEKLKAEGRFEATAFELADAPYINTAVLTEETGEVARAVHEKDQAKLVEELVQVAAVAMAWAEGITYAGLKRAEAPQFMSPEAVERSKERA